MKAVFLTCILATLSAQALGLKCPTCFGVQCQSGEIKNLECLPHTPNLANLKALMSPKSNNGEFVCLEVNYEIGELKQCAFVAADQDLCQDLAAEVKIEECSVAKKEKREARPLADTTTTAQPSTTECQEISSTTTPGSTTTTVTTTTDGEASTANSPRKYADLPPCPNPDSAVSVSVSAAILVVALLCYLQF